MTSCHLYTDEIQAQNLKHARNTSVQMKILFSYHKSEKFRRKFHCLQSVRTWSFSGPYLHAVRLNGERYGGSLRIQSECGKIRTIKFPNADTFHAVVTTFICKTQFFWFL